MSDKEKLTQEHCTGSTITGVSYWNPHLFSVWMLRRKYVFYSFRYIRIVFQLFVLCIY